jgi:arylsulfatase A-like enzyme
LQLGLNELKPDVTIMWLSDPDHTAHEKGMGAAETLDALRRIDAEIGRIVRAHKAADIAGGVDVLVTSDHGFSTHVGGANIAALLREHALDEGVIVSAEAIYVRSGGRQRVEQIVSLLQRQPWAGAIFTRGAEPLPGTLPQSLIRWDHERGADIVVSANWDAGKNEHGYAGRTTQGGVAGHGTTSPFDIHNTLIAAGPSFKTGPLRSPVPTSNVDIAPTICRMLGIPIPDSMDGRVIKEGLVGGPMPGELDIDHKTHVAELPGYRLELDESFVGAARYVDGTRVTR